MGEYEIDDSSDPLDHALIKAEEEALLRRELAFISSDYRTIVVAYYIENRRTADIAASLGLPKGTVESKLFRARQKLKEGMNMAREFGKRSYNPDNVTFTNNCNAFGKNGQPWTILNHLLYQNIFLQAYNNPSTAEELALELGIALPYMENELN
nr:RNA polymerase sigma factor [Clostridia bacterium]